MRGHARGWVPRMLVAALLAIPASAKADPIVMTLDPTHTIDLGDMVTFFGSLSNLGPGEVFLNGASLDCSAVPLEITCDSSPFLSNAPLSLGFPDTTLPFGFFDVFVGLTAAPGTYIGSFTVTGGANATQGNTLVTRDFEIVVPQPVPEPATITLLGIGLAGAVAARRRRRG